MQPAQKHSYNTSPWTTPLHLLTSANTFHNMVIIKPRVRGGIAKATPPPCRGWPTTVQPAAEEEPSPISPLKARMVLPHSYKCGLRRRQGTTHANPQPRLLRASYSTAMYKVIIPGIFSNERMYNQCGMVIWKCLLCTFPSTILFHYSSPSSPSWWQWWLLCHRTSITLPRHTRRSVVIRYW